MHRLSASSHRYASLRATSPSQPEGRPATHPPAPVVPVAGGGGPFWGPSNPHATDPRHLLSRDVTLDGRCSGLAHSHGVAQGSLNRNRRSSACPIPWSPS